MCIIWDRSKTIRQVLKGYENSSIIGAPFRTFLKLEWQSIVLRLLLVFLFNFILHWTLYTLSVNKFYLFFLICLLPITGTCLVIIWCNFNELCWKMETSFWNKILCWVIDCCLTPTQQLFSYNIARTSYFSMRWWWGLLCTRPTCLVGFL